MEAESVKTLTKQLQTCFVSWERLRTCGGQDPFWPDGANMNLERNHIICLKDLLGKRCEEEGVQLPEWYYKETPPEVPNGYMCRQGEYYKLRMQRLRQFGNHGITNKQPRGLEEQENFLF